MCADFRALFQNHHRQVGIDLLQADGGRQPGRTGSDDHDVELHRFAFGQGFSFAHNLFHHIGFSRLRRGAFGEPGRTLLD